MCVCVMKDRKKGKILTFYLHLYIKATMDSALQIFDVAVANPHTLIEACKDPLASLVDKRLGNQVNCSTVCVEGGVGCRW